MRARRQERDYNLKTTSNRWRLRPSSLLVKAPIRLRHYLIIRASTCQTQESSHFFRSPAHGHAARARVLRLKKCPCHKGFCRWPDAHVTPLTDIAAKRLGGSSRPQGRRRMTPAERGECGSRGPKPRQLWLPGDSGPKRPAGRPVSRFRSSPQLPLDRCELRNR